MSTSDLGQPAPTAAAPQRTFLGHPLGLYVLFFTEMWERFSFYGMRALLILYMTEYFKWSQRDASNVYKWYTSLVYLTPLLGGFLADRWLGNKRAVIIGALLMAVGQFLMTFGEESIFYYALVFLIFGNGFFKPNMSAQVGRLYPQNDTRRDGAYTIFYMGINLGAFLSPLVCGWLAVNTLGGRHTGFMAAGIGMLLGLIVYLVGLRWVVELKPDTTPQAEASGAERSSDVMSEEQAEKTPSTVPGLNRLAPPLFRLVGYALLIGTVALGAIRLAIALCMRQALSVPNFLPTISLSEYLANNTLISLGIVAVCALIAGWILSQSQRAMRDRVLTIYVLGIFVVFFWAAFEQAGNALNVWADKTTDRYLTTQAPVPSLFPDKPTATKEEKGQEGQESTATTDTGVSRWITMWRLKPSKTDETGKKTDAGLWQWFVALWNPVATEWFQSINALAIFLLAPLFAWLWTVLGRHNPSVPTKMAIGVLLMCSSFGLMIVAARRENQPTSVAFSGPLPSEIKIGPGDQLCAEEDKELKPYQAGRLTYDKAANMLHMRGVLGDTERDRIVRDTAPESFVKAVKELQKKSQDAKGDHFTVSVKLDPVPPGFDMQYAGLDESKVRYDDETHTLSVTDFRLADKDVKALLVTAGEPAFREAINALYQQSAKLRVSAWWLFWFYILATLAELCLSPVGLSMVSKLAPAKFATMLMGLWLLTSFFGNFAAGAFGERWGEWTPTEYFLYIMALLGGAALVLFLLVRKIASMMHGVK